MKKFLLFPLITVLLVFLATAFSLEAAEKELSASLPATGISLTWGRPSNIIDIGLGYLFSSTDCSWEISFLDQDGRNKSVLKFKGIRSGIPLVFLEINHPKSYASLSFQFGKGHGSDGEGTDSDYLSKSTYYRSRFDVSGETAFWIADIQTTFIFNSRPRWVFKPFIGWQYYEQNIHMTHGRWTTYINQDNNTPIYGLDSRYDFNWNALRVGVKGEVALTAARPPGIIPLRLKSQLAFFPYIHYTGRGVWNLREDLQSDPSFSHKADNFGLVGMDGVISLVYQPMKLLEIEGGARMSYFYVQDGSDITYFSDNTETEVNLDEAKAVQVGFFLTITGRF